MKTILIIIALAIAPVFTGCSIFAPKSDITWEGSRYLSFKDVWIVTHKAYQVHMDQVAQGKVSEADQHDVNTAWNAFRGAYLIALEAAQYDNTSFTPENVRKLADDVLILISSL